MSDNGPDRIIQTALGPLQVRTARADDLDDVLAILEEAEQWLTSNGIQQWAPGTHRPFRAEFADAIEKQLIHLATRDDGEVVAIVALSWSGGGLWPDSADDNAGYVSKLAVRRAYSGQNLGLDPSNSRFGTITIAAQLHRFESASL
jgi:hypothetical protein